MNQIPKCHICGAGKVIFHEPDEEPLGADGKLHPVCPDAEKHDSRPKRVAWHLPERVMIIEGLRHKFYDYRKEITK